MVQAKLVFRASINNFFRILMQRSSRTKHYNALYISKRNRHKVAKYFFNCFYHSENRCNFLEKDKILYFALEIHLFV